jgi:hypothetical protein
MKGFGLPFGFLNPTVHVARFHWTSDHLVEKASNDTGQNNIYKHKDKYSCPNGIRTRDPSNQAAKTYNLDGPATGTGHAMRMYGVMEV